MKNDKTKTHELYDQIRAAMIKSGIEYWGAYDALVTLDSYIYASIVQEIVDSLDAEKNLELYDLLKDNPTNEKISEFLGISLEEMNERHIKKLEEYLVKIPRSLERSTEDNISI